MVNLFDRVIQNRLLYRRMVNIEDCEVCFYEGDELLAKQELSVDEMNSLIRETTLAQRIMHIRYDEQSETTVIQNKEIASRL